MTDTVSCSKGCFFAAAVQSCMPVTLNSRIILRPKDKQPAEHFSELRMLMDDCIVQLCPHTVSGGEPEQAGLRDS